MAVVDLRRGEKVVARSIRSAETVIAFAQCSIIHVNRTPSSLSLPILTY